MAKRKKPESDLIKTRYFDGSGLKGPDDPESQWAIDHVQEFRKWLSERQILGRRYAGYDIARKKHLSAIWVIEKISVMKFTRMIIVLEKCPFWFQKLVLFAVLDIPNFGRACIDAQGMGANLAEDAKYAYGRHKVEEIEMLAGVKEEMAIYTKLEIESKRHLFPADKDVRDDLHSVRKYITTTKHDRFDAKATDNGHGDRFWALCLADRAASDTGGESTPAVTKKRPVRTKITRGF